MIVAVDPFCASHLIVKPPRHTLAGAILLSVFGAITLLGGVNTLVTQAPQFRIYGILLLCLALPALLAGVCALFDRTRFVFDTAVGTLCVERSGVFRSRETSHELSEFEAVVLVRYWLFNRVARAEPGFWYRLQLHTAAGTHVELAHKLSPPVASKAGEAIASHLDLPLLHREGRVEGIIAGP